MARIITIPNDNDPVMNAERDRIVPWAATHGWIFTGYNNEADHIAQVRRASGGSSLDVLDFDCHGNPTVFDHTYLNTAVQFGRTLSQSTGFSGNTAIYLDACNTGLSSAYGGPIAQAVADAARCTVYGTKGYMTGTYAEGNERCYASVNGLAPYPGAQDAAGRNVWLSFRARGMTQLDIAELRSVTVGVDASGRVWATFDPNARSEVVMSESSSHTIHAGAKDAAGLASLLEDVLKSTPVEFPQLRIAPDVTINYMESGQMKILDVYANGALLRDRVSGVTWRVDNPHDLNARILQMR